jgi:pantetheine-phosphate adenylyltransferase
MDKRPCTAIYPGTFDPLTNGHVSLIKRGLEVFDSIVLAVARDTSKTPLFSLDERVAMARECLADLDEVVVEPFGGLLVDYVARKNVSVILRGLRAISDFEYEFQMALMNRRLNRDIQTVFMMTDFKWLYVSSSVIREAAKYGGNVKGLVPDPIVSHIYAKYAELNAR